MFHVIEKFRITKNSSVASDNTYGNNGAFLIPHYKIADYYFFCIVSDGEGWEHVSVSLRTSKKQVERSPTWEDMCFIKNTFWDEEDVIVQFHPAKRDYVNNHKWCLHLWGGVKIKTPDPSLVGIVK